MNSENHQSESTITALTRRNIIDSLRVHGVNWSGRLNDVDFLYRIYPLSEMNSTDSRFQNAKQDIYMHRVNFEDWDDDWIFEDSRFGLRHGDDATLLRFLCEMVHPVVRSDKNEIEQLVADFNEHLRPDGWQIKPLNYISGRPVYAPKRIDDFSSSGITVATNAAQTLGSEYIQQQITRMETSITGDPELAIGTAKEFLETICKTVIQSTGSLPSNDELPSLIRCAIDQVHFELHGTEDPKRAEAAIKRLLGNLSGIGGGVAEVRNAMGSGHGKSASTAQPDPMYARLVVGTATTLGLFLFEAILNGQDSEISNDVSRSHPP